MIWVRFCLLDPYHHTMIIDPAKLFGSETLTVCIGCPGNRFGRYTSWIRFPLREC